jgi:glucose-1-phosphate thymidylyltransferase
VILGDSILENSIRKAREIFEQQNEGALILLKEVPDPERFDVPMFEGSRIVWIEEKPKLPASSYAVIGVYFYDATVFDRVGMLKPSGRGEFEITDINNSYLRDGQLSYDRIDGGWTDAGTFESLWRATKMVRERALLAEELALPSMTGPKKIALPEGRQAYEVGVTEDRRGKSS